MFVSSFHGFHQKFYWMTSDEFWTSTKTMDSSIDYNAFTIRNYKNYIWPLPWNTVLQLDFQFVTSGDIMNANLLKKTSVFPRNITHQYSKH